MATQGPLYPGTVTTEAVSTENANDWLTPGNISADDGAEAQITAATYDSPDISFRLKATNFGFTIPAGSTINGITVEIDRRSIILNSGKDFRVQLLDAAGALVGTNKANTALVWPTTSTVASYGGAADTWTAAPSVAMVNDPAFGVVLSVQANIANADIGVDFIRVTVTYTAPAFSTFERAVAIDGAVAIASAGQFFSILEAATAFNATGAIESAGVRLAPPVERSAALSATGSIVTAGQRDLQRQIAVAATGVVQTTPQRDLQRQVAVAATGLIAVAGQVESGVVTHQRAASLSATGAIASAGIFWSVFERSSALSAIGAVASAGRRDLLRSGALSATANIVSASQRELLRAAAVSAVAAIASTGAIQTAHERSVALSAIASITVLVPSLTLPGTIDHGGGKTAVDAGGGVTVVEGARYIVVID